MELLNQIEITPPTKRGICMHENRRGVPQCDAKLKVQEKFGLYSLRNVFPLAETHSGKCSQTAIPRG